MILSFQGISIVRSFYAKGVIIVDKEKEKQDTEFYRSEIVRMISGVDRIDLLMYLHRLISNILKAGH